MRIMTILGSPRIRGNTAKTLHWIEGQFQADGHELDQVNILDYNVGGCRECLGCKKAVSSGLCLFEDDANGLFLRMVKADLVLIAAPVFCWGFPAQLKGLIDRLYCLMDFDELRTDVPRLHGKPIALLLTAGGEGVDNADLVSRGFQHVLKLLHARPAGQWLVANCTNPESLGDDVQKQAMEFAKTLTGETSRSS